MQSSTCPFCLGTVSVLAVAKAPLPNMIQCQNCGQKLGFEMGMGKLLALYVMISIPVAVVALVVVTVLLNFWVALFAMTGLLLVYDFLFSVVVARTATFTKPNA